MTIRLVIALPMQPTEADDAPDSQNGVRQINFNVDREHAEALERIMRSERLDKSNTLRKLIRIADQLISGKDSPFASRLESLLRKAG